MIGRALDRRLFISIVGPCILVLVAAGCLGVDVASPVATDDAGSQVDASSEGGETTRVDGSSGDSGQNGELDSGSADAREDAGPSSLRAFLTNGTRSGGFGATVAQAMAQADAFCVSQAATGSKTIAVPGRTWRALLSTGNDGAVKRIKGGGPWRRTDGALVRGTAFTPQDFVTSTPVNLDQNGAVVSSPTAWVGGIDFRNPSFYPDCSNWTSGTSSCGTSDCLGQYGEPLGTDATAWFRSANAGCDTLRHVYCFEDVE